MKKSDAEPEPKTLEEARKQESTKSRLIPLYAEDGQTIIGSFEIGQGIAKITK